MSLLDDTYGDDNRSVLEVALDQATPNRISRAWVRHRVEEVIGQLSTVLDDEQLEGVHSITLRRSRIQALGCLHGVRLRAV